MWSFTANFQQCLSSPIPLISTTSRSLDSLVCLKPTFTCYALQSQIETFNGTTDRRISERNEIRFGLPSKGRMATDTLELLKDCQLSVKQVNPRQYVANISQLSGLEVWFQRPKDIVRKLLSGDLDLGIVGLDTVSEYGQGSEDLIIVHEALEYGDCRLSLAIPKYGIFENINSIQDLAQMPQWTEAKPLRVATGFSYLGPKFLREKGLEHVSFSTADGALEAAPAGIHPPPQLAAMVAIQNSQFLTAQNSPSSTWLNNSGCNAHITSDFGNLSVSREYIGEENVSVGSRHSLPISHTGCVFLGLEDNKTAEGIFVTQAKYARCQGISPIVCALQYRFYTPDITFSMGIADAILDLVSSGTTLRENNLKEIKGGVVLESQAVLLASRKSLVQRKGALDTTHEILERLEAHLMAVGQFTVTANMRGNSAQEVAERVLSQPSLSGMQGPTISPVFCKRDGKIVADYYAIVICVPKKSLYKSVQQLRAIGGSGVLISPLTYIFDEETPRWNQLLKELGL